jgi:hypothetical protein
VKSGIYLARGGATFDDVRIARITALEPRWMNTSRGDIQDGLGTDEDQLGVFDASYPLERVARIEASGDSTIFPSETRFGAARGWAASGILDRRDTRWIPLLEAFDRYGRARGAAGALLIHSSGPFAGSHWGIFGVESEDLFARGRDAALDGLGRLLRAMDRKVWLHSLACRPAGLLPLETLSVSLRVENGGRAPAPATIEIHVAESEAKGATRAPTRIDSRRELVVAPLESALVELPISLPPEARGLHRVSAVLHLDGREWDRMETGVFALSTEPRARAPALALEFRDNYFRQGGRNLFLFGSDAYSNVYAAAAGPLDWTRELGAARDHGFTLYENLQYKGPTLELEESDWRRFLAIARIAEETGLVFMPGILIGHDASASGPTLERESALAREYARRLGDLPSLVWYLNGDYQLRVTENESLRPEWSRFLLERHGSPEDVAKA